MECARKIAEQLYWVGGNDRRLALFESLYPIPRGVSYNSYLLLDEKTVLLDGVDHAVSRQFFENIAAVLNGRPLDYMIVQHMEPDHAASIEEVIRRYPDITLICNKKTEAMLSQFFSESCAVQTVDATTVFTTGTHTFSFVMAPMVHWPEVMVSYDRTAKILFSADAFGTFGALNGTLFANPEQFRTEWLPEARRYYTNIVGKYGAPVQALLKAAAGLDITMICPLHGPVLHQELSRYLNAYQAWSSYTPEEKGVCIVYASVYGHTENAAELLAARLADNGVTSLAVYDAAVTHPSYLVAEAFRYSHLVFAAPSYNAGIFDSMEFLLRDLVHHNLQNRKIALLENGSWAPTAAKGMAELIGQLKNCELISQPISIRSAVKAEQASQINALACSIADQITK